MTCAFGDGPDKFLSDIMDKSEYLETLVGSAIHKIKMAAAPHDNSRIGKARRAYVEAAGFFALTKRDFEKMSTTDESWEAVRKAAAVAYHDFISAHHDLIKAEEDER